MSDITKPIRPIITGTPGVSTAKTQRVQPAGQNPNAFADLLRTQLRTQQALTLSKHAQARAEQRGITLTEADMRRLGEAAQKAQEKGIRDGLVLMDSNAFIINIPSRVVVTMVDRADQETVFTNIDGAVII